MTSILKVSIISETFQKCLCVEDSDSSWAYNILYPIQLSHFFAQAPIYCFQYVKKSLHGWRSYRYPMRKIRIFDNRITKLKGSSSRLLKRFLPLYHFYYTYILRITSSHFVEMNILPVLQFMVFISQRINTLTYKKGNRETYVSRYNMWFIACSNIFLPKGNSEKKHH